MIVSKERRIKFGGANFCGGDTQYENAARSFKRTGRHGTCDVCPFDDDGWSLPENCSFRDRYDHTSGYKPDRARYRS